MMKKINKLLFFAIALLIVPFIEVYAECSPGDKHCSAGKYNQTGAIPCKETCKGIKRNYGINGIRVTFVDAAGQQVAGTPSNDYLTTSHRGSWTTNVLEGFKPKTVAASAFAAGTKSQGDYVGFGELAKKFDEYAEQFGSPTRSGLAFPYSGGKSTDGFAKESRFFKSIASSANPYYQLDINAFVYAFAETSKIRFDPKALILALEEGCKKGNPIFILAEPMTGLYNFDTGQNWLGTIGDCGHFMMDLGDAIPDYILKNVANVWTYEEDEWIPDYVGQTPLPVGGGGYTIVSPADTFNQIGFGMHLNWATDAEGGCASCTFTADGYFTYNDVIYTPRIPIPNGFSSVARYALTDRKQGGAGCCVLLGDRAKAKWPAEYKELCDIIPPDTCDEEVEEPLEKDYNNCCEATHSKIEETKIDDLFCEDESLCVLSFKKKKFSEKYYKDPNWLTSNKYCDMFCTERLEIDIPGPVTDAKTGRYFRLVSNAAGSGTGPHVEGYRRCRSRIDFDKWYTDYYNKVDEEVKAYNQFQFDYAYYKMYNWVLVNGITENMDETVTYTTTCSWSKTNSDPNCSAGGTAVSPSPFQCSYTGWQSFDKMYDIYNIKIEEKKYTSLEVIEGDQNKTAHPKWSADGLAGCISGADGKLGEGKCIPNSCSSGSPSTSRTKFKYEAGDTKYDENVPKEEKRYFALSESDKKTFRTATEQAKVLEENIDECDYWFEPDGSKIKPGGYPGKNPNDKKNFDFEPEVDFAYSQVYLSEAGTLQDSYIGIDFVRTCTYSIKTTKHNGADGKDIFEDHYSNCKYKTGEVSVLDMHGQDIEIKYDEFGQYFALNPKHQDPEYDPYMADKKFNADAVYEAVCDWDDKENEVYTVSPSGLAINMEEYNSTIHEKEYSIFLTTLDGTYETFWNLGRMGHKGRMDKYFDDTKYPNSGNGQSCAGESKEESAMFTCKIHVTHTIVYTGTCEAPVTNTYPKGDCHLAEDDFKLFNFKVVEPNPDDFFPNGTSTDEGTIAANWFDDEDGAQVIAQMKATASTNSTYANDHVSYLFTLNPQSMKKIQKYNAFREERGHGGYGDYELNCYCPSGVVDTSENGAACIMCKSAFIENLSNNFVYINGSQESVKGVWQGGSLDKVRSENFEW